MFTSSTPVDVTADFVAVICFVFVMLYPSYVATYPSGTTSFTVYSYSR